MISTSCILMSIILGIGNALADGGCRIESSPIPELAQYTRSVDTRISEIKKTGVTTTTTCGITSAWASASADKTLETIDRAFMHLPAFDDIYVDFLFNIKIAINGDTRSPVSRDVMIFNQTEKKITNSLMSITNQCNLTDSVKSEFTTLLQENQILEDVYKQAALGTPIVPSGLSEENIKVAEAINGWYVPTATEWCKDKKQSLGDSLEEIVQKTLAMMEWNGKNSEWVMVDWKRGIAIFQWLGNGKTIEESIRQKWIQLKSELTRNGFSPRMAQTMLSNFDCFKAKTTWDDSFEAAIKARASCLSNPILGIENMTLLPLRKQVDEAKTIPERVNAVNQLWDRKKETMDIQKMYSDIEIMKTPAIDLRSELMSNLIDLHMALLFTSEAIEKRLPAIYKDCMKGQPDVTCPKMQSD